MVAACGSNKEPLGPTATVPQATTTTNPYAVPLVIDVAYVNRVLAGLDQAVGDVTRLVKSAETITNEAADRLTALYLGDALVLKLQIVQNDVLHQFPGYRDDPGNKKTIVTELITARSDCIFAKVSKDFSAVADSSNPQLSTQWVNLVPLDSRKDPAGYNLVGWMFAYDGFRSDLSAPPNPCVE
jgi:hypothetical protein